MIAELILIRNLLDKTPLNGSTPIRADLPKSFVKPFQKSGTQRPKTITRKKSIGPALGLKKYF
jgi:hypothetical protein